MRKIAILLSLFALVSLSSFAHANHIKTPVVPVVEPDNPDIILVSKKAQPLPCGTLMEEMISDTVGIELWIVRTWAGAAHPFIIMRMYRVNEKVEFEVWLDRNSDGHPDEYFDTTEAADRFQKKYPTECDAVTVTK